MLGTNISILEIFKSDICCDVCGSMLPGLEGIRERMATLNRAIDMRGTLE